MCYNHVDNATLIDVCLHQPVNIVWARQIHPGGAHECEVLLHVCGVAAVGGVLLQVLLLTHCEGRYAALWGQGWPTVTQVIACPFAALSNKSTSLTIVSSYMETVHIAWLQPTRVPLHRRCDSDPQGLVRGNRSFIYIFIQVIDPRRCAR